jgi:hypothetical protein
MMQTCAPNSCQVAIETASTSAVSKLKTSGSS